MLGVKGATEMCRKCIRESSVKYRETNHDELRERFKKWHQANMETYRASKRASNKKHAVKIAVQKRSARLKRNYGLTLEDYEHMLAEQGGACAICHDTPNGRWTKLNIDHCHITGKVRGLLCVNCNRALGYLKDDPSRAIRCAEYLQISKEGKLP